MPLITRPGKPTLYVALDDCTDPWAHRPTVLLQHGYGRSGVFWYRWIAALARHYRVVRPDWRGFGQSPLDFDADSGYTAASLIDDLRTVIERTGGGPVHYVGESLGGTLGLMLAAQSPELLRSVTLISSPASVPEGTREALKLGHGSWEDALRALGTRGWVAATNGITRFPPQTAPALMDWYTDEMGKTNLEAMVAMGRATHTIDARPVLSSVRVPVLGLYPQDGAITGSQQALIRTHVPNMRYVELGTRFHAIQFLMADQCAAQWRAFADAITP